MPLLSQIMSADQDNQLINNYLNGETIAFDFLIGNYYKQIYVFLYRYTNNRQDAEDLTQEVFVKIWKNLKKFNQEKNFKSWLFAIAKNTAIDFFRKKKSIPFSDFEDQKGHNPLVESLSEPTPLPEDIWQSSNLTQKLEAIIDQLPSNYRLVLLMHYQDDLTFQKISEILNESLNTIKSWHYRAVIKLRKLLLE